MNKINKISDLKVGDKVALMNGDIDIFIHIRGGCGAARLEKYHHVHNDRIDWKKTNELNNNQMEFKIEVPEGYQIDKDKSTFEKIVFKEIESKLPMSVSEIPNRKFYITNDSNIVINNNKRVLSTGRSCINQLSTKERAEAFLALMQLVELRDVWNGDSERHLYLIYRENKTSNLLSFKTLELRNQFSEQFKDLIEQAKELL